MATATKSKIKARPLDDRVILQPTVAEDRTKSGIYLPEGAQEKPMTGTVIATGPGKLSDDGGRSEMTVKKGDLVVYGKYAGTEIELNGEDYVIVRESELLGVIE